MIDSLEIYYSLGFISYAASAAAYLFVLVVFLLGYRAGQKGAYFVLLLTTTLAWGCVLALSQVGWAVPFSVVVAADLLRYLGWFVVLKVAVQETWQSSHWPSRQNPLSLGTLAFLLAAAVLSLVFSPEINRLFNLNSPIVVEIAWMLVLSLIGLMLVEQMYRGVQPEERHQVVYLSICAGGVFAYDFFVFSNAMLVQNIDYEFWSARGLVSILLLPPLALAAVRNPQIAPNLHMSRQFVFHTSTLLGAGIYLVLMSLAGYYIEASTGNWGKTLQVLFLFIGAIFLVMLFLSDGVKTRWKQFLSRSFRNKYDYRVEWKRFSRTLLNADTAMSLESRSIQAIAQIVDSPGGKLWICDEGKFQLRTSWMVDGEAEPDLIDNALFFEVIDNSEMPMEFDFYYKSVREDKSLKKLINIDDWWVIIPLRVGDKLHGFVQLQKPVIYHRLDVEDLDLLSTVAHHVALSLAFKQTDSALRNAEQFLQVNQMTAFMLHDLKTVLSQLSLIIENEARHRDNPAFIDDVFTTIKHVAEKVQRLVQQVKDPAARAENDSLNLRELLNSIASSYSTHDRHPMLRIENGVDPRISANAGELESAIKHLVHNAYEATDDDDGVVSLSMTGGENGYFVVSIEDNGPGMSPEFIADRLFRPFDSTKGVAGMGVGVYQSREYIRSLGGQLRVKSRVGEGTRFDILLPGAGAT